MNQRVVLAALVVGLVVCAGVGQAQRSGAFPVIVVFRAEAALDVFESEYRHDNRADADPDNWKYLSRGVVGAVQHLERRHGFQAEHVFGSSIRGFSAKLSARQIDDLEHDGNVAFVEADGTMEAIAQTLPWGIDRIDADASSTHAGDGSGAVTNVNVYVIDTGADASHQDLNVVGHVNVAGGPNRDCNGHGTHVAGTIAAKDNSIDVVGVVPGAPITGVKVLGCSGSGSTSGVIKGIDYVTANAKKPAIANMSLGGGVSDALDAAVRRSVASGVFYSIAAGNSGADACTSSPARAGTTNGVMVAAGIDASNNEASWSNFGSCVDIHAPGVNILSTRLGGGTTTMSGTSMASPHVAGTGALYLSSHTGATPADVEAALKADAVATGTTSKSGGAIKRVNAGIY